MTGKEFLKRFEASGIPLSAVYKVCVNAPEFDKEVFKKKAPGAFDYKGNLRTVFKDHQSAFPTYCPFPGHKKKQQRGDAFVLHNKSHSFHCYGGCGSDRPLNVVQFVMCLILGVSPEVAAEFELSKIFFWPAVRFLVKHFDKELGISLADVSKKAVYKEDVKQKILQATVDYYHFLATEVGKYSDKIDRYYLEERFFKYVYTKEEFQEHKINSKIGITPSSPDNNMLYKKLKKLKFSDKDILNARVCIKLDDGRIIDAYRNHAIIPYTYGDRIIGLYGKNFNKNAKIKHKRLDGYYDTPTSLQNIVNEEEFYFVEGDNTEEALFAILKERGGLYELLMRRPILKTMGSKGFKDEHAVILGNYREADPRKLKVAYSIFDPDSAGRKGTLSVGRKLQNISKIKVMVIRMPILEKDGKPWHLDVNDLFEAYQENAGIIFEKLKKNAISLDAFTVLYFLEEEGIRDYADARIALKRHAQYLDYVPKEERLFIMEELLDLLIPVFEGEINRTELRNDLKELLMDRPVLKRTEETILEEEEALKELGLGEEEEVIEEDDLEDVGPIGPTIPAIEGFEVFDTIPSAPFWMITQDEEFYKQHKERMLGLLFVNKLERMEEEIPNGTKMILYDDSFNEKDFNSISKFETFKFHFEEDEKGKLQTIYERK